MTTFAAIDFETANYRSNSACAVGVVVVSHGRVVQRFYELIRPPSNWFVFTHIHGLTWRDVRNAPAFGDIWPQIAKEMGQVEFLAAHNASFDQGVMLACCAENALPPPAPPFICTVRLSRKQWNIHPTKLPDVCRQLQIPLHHHHAASDAEACAQIVLTALNQGWRPG
ncbi:3'-5' exonuclease [Desulfurivibrio alkaliphilus]|uniref:Exonuclease RNase T and DNA polymerase III n=1 Tax=Desulfurivibrio alkaliphilus (strain DSM 19089 / UNIQEM U267 / AHT2) TaxID=589865 RepID=D6Z1F8_DESAT|nr:3'-5' exonuclease [Desulfurivibrio alkaliphilus]ADH85413.1 Exonuclease RNase T and DNA polymerase III [Desulfurivibrio alkaliphilus AHT 2]